jgi:two-component system cell cycle sensor histidine kinase/response regulator CckA
MNENNLKEVVDSLEIQLKHLRNDFELTKEEYELASAKYLDILAELKGKNKELVNLHKNLEKMVAQRTRQLEKAKKNLQQKSEELQTMIDSSPAMIFYKDKNNRYIRVNKAFAQVTGLPIKKIIGKKDKELFEKKSHFLQDDSADLKEIRKGKPILNKEESFQTKNGIRVLLVNKIPYKNIDGKTEGVIGFALDITDRRRLEEEQSKASKLESLGLLAGGIAHDFNNILTAILGNISLGEALVNKDAEIYRRLKEAENACLRAKDLTQQLLTFSKGGAPIKTSTSIADLIKESAWFSLHGSNIRCEFDIAEDLWCVEVDEAQITQVINNLIVNAKQAMEDGGKIKVTAENYISPSNGKVPLKVGKYIRLCIEDQGHGIAEEHLSKIFDPYFTTKAQASGLGITTAWSIIKKHGGSLTVESEKGIGTMFEIYLPAATQPVKEEKGVPEQAETIKAKVLVMDDEKLVRKVAGNLLEHLGHEVKIAKDGREAITLYKRAKKTKRPFDVLILDLTVSDGMGGKKTLEKLLDFDPDVKAIVSTGYSSDPVLSDYKNIGFKGFVIKPYKIDQLTDILRKVLLQKK